MYVYVCFLQIYTHTYVCTHVRTYVRTHVRTYQGTIFKYSMHASWTDSCCKPYMKTLAAQSNALCLLVIQLFPHSCCIESFSKLTEALFQSLIPNDQFGMRLIN